MGQRGTQTMRTKKISVDKLLSDPANVRKHDERNIDAIKASLQKFGQQKPIVVDKNGIVVAGNGTLEACKQLGWKDISVVETELVGADATAFAIADNRTSELAIWDDDALAQTLASLQDDDSIDELVSGFTAKEIDDLIGKTADDIEEMKCQSYQKKPSRKLVICGCLVRIMNAKIVASGTTMTRARR